MPQQKFKTKILELTKTIFDPVIQQLDDDKAKLLQTKLDEYIEQIMILQNGGNNNDSATEKNPGNNIYQMDFKTFAHNTLEGEYKTKPSTLRSAKSLMNGLIKYAVGFDKLSDLKKKSATLLKTILGMEKSQETKRKYIYYVSLLLKKLKMTAQREEYMNAYTKLKTDIETERKQNKVRSEKEEKSIENTLEKMRKIEINNEQSDPKSLLFNLLIHLDETPRLEYRELIYNPKSNLDEKNYLQVSNNTIKLVLNKYKTSDKYGTWTINIANPKLKKYIKHYIEQNCVKPDQYIFVNRKGNIYPSNKFSEYVQKTFKQKVGTPIRMNDLRKIKEMELFHKAPKTLKKSLAEREKFVEDKFKHSHTTAQTYYNRVDEKQSEQPAPKPKLSAAERRKIANRKYYLKSKEAGKRKAAKQYCPHCKKHVANMTMHRRSKAHQKNVKK